VIIPITVDARPVRPPAGLALDAGPGEGEAMKAWMQREQWFMWLALVVVLTLVLAAIGYLIGLWPELPVAAAPSKPPLPPNCFPRK